jgi:hypothetical protein
MASAPGLVFLLLVLDRLVFTFEKAEAQHPDIRGTSSSPLQLPQKVAECASYFEWERATTLAAIAAGDPHEHRSMRSRLFTKFHRVKSASRARMLLQVASRYNPNHHNPHPANHIARGRSCAHF